MEDLATKEIFVDEHKTPPILTTFEKVKIITERVNQLNRGYKSTIEDVIKKENLIKSYDIAMKEFELNKIPKYFVKRKLPNNTYEIWEHSDFKFFPRS